MRMMQILWVGIVIIFLNACGGGENNSEPSAQTSQSTTNTQLIVDAGEDKRAVIFEGVLIQGTVQSSNKASLQYQWVRNEKTLATTEAFTYVPTTLGSHELMFVVQDTTGVSSVDKMNVIVSNEEINTTIPPISKSTVNQYLTVVNQARAVAQDCGSQGKWQSASPVMWNEKLYSSAYEHMQDLIVSQTFSHDGSGGESDWSGYPLGIKSTQVERAENYGYEWSRLGENLGGGASIDTPQKIVNAWLESDSHCANLMNPHFTEMGMVRITDETALYTNYWGQNFGTPK
jgi:uncharacterized protein YkwD